MSDERSITINGAPPIEPGFGELEQALGTALADGDYWYDPGCGACGIVGGPAQGFLPAGLAIAEALPTDASGGGTGVFINGRELHPIDVAALNQILMPFGAQCLPGRWAVDAMGNLGPEGGLPMANLVMMAGSAASGGGPWSTRFSAGNSGGGGGFVQTFDGTFVTHGLG